jgi:hypothetical protein
MSIISIIAAVGLVLALVWLCMAAAVHVSQSARQLAHQREQQAHSIAQISIEHARNMSYEERWALVRGGGPVVVSDKVVDGFRAIEETLMAGQWLGWRVGQERDVMMNDHQQQDVRTECVVVYHPLLGESGSAPIRVKVWPSGRQTDVTILLHPGQSLLLPYGWSYGVDFSESTSNTAIARVVAYDSLGHVVARTVSDLFTFGGGHAKPSSSSST